MEVILLERVNRLGAIGDTVQVRNGYARNFLLPRSKALRATKTNKELFEAQRAEIEKRNAESKAEAQTQATKLEGETIVIVRQASQEGKLYGSITVRDISVALEEAGHDVPKSQLVLPKVIKQTGEYIIKVTLHPEVVVDLPLHVNRLEANLD